MSTRILAIDTTTEACSAALMLDNDVLLKRFTITPREHARYILPMVDDLLTEAGITLKSLDAIAFSRGPGSFTGVRISIGIAQGLALGADLKFISISTLATLAEGAWRQTGICQVLVAINAYVGAVYWAPYQRKAGVWLGEEHEVIASPEMLTSMITNLSGCWATSGNSWQTYPELFRHDGLTLITGNTLLPNARDMLPLALHYYRNDTTQSVVSIEHTYLRNEVV